MREPDEALLADLRRVTAAVDPPPKVIARPPRGAMSMTEIITDPLLLHPCWSWQCNRQTTRSSRYCCPACADAWDAPVRHEPHSHSDGCDERHVARGVVIHG